MSSFSSKSYSQNYMIDSKVILRDIFCDNSVNFLCNYSILYAPGMCDIMYIQHLFTRQMFSLCAVQRYNLPCTITVNATLCVV